MFLEDLFDVLKKWQRRLAVVEASILSSSLPLSYIPPSPTLSSLSLAWLSLAFAHTHRLYVDKPFTFSACSIASHRYITDKSVLFVHKLETPNNFTRYTEPPRLSSHAGQETFIGFDTFAGFRLVGLCSGYHLVRVLFFLRRRVQYLLEALACSNITSPCPSSAPCCSMSISLLRRVRVLVCFLGLLQPVRRRLHYTIFVAVFVPRLGDHSFPYLYADWLAAVQSGCVHETTPAHETPLPTCYKDLIDY